MEIELKLLENVKSHLDVDQLWIDFSEEWGASKTDHRYKTREAICERLIFLLDHRAFDQIDDIAREKLELKQLMDLKRVPGTTFASISISHTNSIGGFAITPAPVGIGLDIETKIRLADNKAIRRVSTQEELTMAPNEAFLWVAKESAYKSLVSPYQPPVISHIQITNWEGFTDGHYTFKFHLDRSSTLGNSGWGTLLQLDKYLVALTRS